MVLKKVSGHRVVITADLSKMELFCFTQRIIVGYLCCTPKIVYVNYISILEKRGTVDGADLYLYGITDMKLKMWHH